jgi:X-Pro dipeptidyl-peptidase
VGVRRAVFLTLLVCAFPATAGAATPASGTVSPAAPNVAWQGSVTGGYLSYAAMVAANAGGLVGSVPCAPLVCDSFALTVSGAGQDLVIGASSPDTDIVTVRLTAPDGSVIFADPAVTTVRVPRAATGTWHVDITTNAVGASGYTATAGVSPSPPDDGGPPTTPTFTYEKVRVPMRDGVELSTEIWRPVVPPETKVPVILHLTPYHVLSPTNDPSTLPMVDGVEMVRRGYAFVFADVRGTWSSGGCWDYGGIQERHDGYDLVEWLGTRPWTNGKVAMMGVSYPGTTPNAAAVEQPPHLATIIPISGISRWWGYAYQQGTRATYSGESDDIDPPSDTPTDFMFAYGFLPPPDPDALVSARQQIAMRWNVCDRVEQALHGYSTQPDYDDFWKERDYLRLADRVKVPVLISHGLLDFNVKTWEGTAWYEAIHGPKMLVLGQWPHAYPGTYYADWQEKILEPWLARWLYGVENGIEDQPRVHVQTQDGVWHVQDDWPAKSHRDLPLAGGQFEYLDDGLLTESEVLRGVGEGVRWARVPVPDSSGLRFGGRPVLNLRVKSDKPSTHFTAVLCDVGPDGACTLISRAFMNARYRGGREVGEDLVPGQWTDVDLQFIDKDWVIAADHHLELRIASSSNTWVAPNLERATNTLDLDASELVLPVYGA